ncbi:MAG: U32 family peptidase [Bacteroidales bacterium]|nr:U32 family peptidase [Bacteroidales bacterium]
MIEIMSPAGSYESLMAAINAGAGSIYFGVGALNMRSRSAANFTLDDLQQITDICREHNVSSYLTVNTIVYNDEIQKAHELLDTAKRCQVTAIIASDMAVIQYARQIGLEIHLSTQCNVTNVEAVRYYAQFADVVVLGRECNLKHVADICETIRKENICGPKGELVKIEMFVHGALCMAVSGKCYLSLDNFNYPANRGACIQPCRRAYKVQDLETELELMIDNKYIMSPKDLCTIGFLDKIIKAGVGILKIEGRGRSAEYVKIVTQCYHEALDAIQNGTFTKEKTEQWMTRLRSVYNRDFWDGYYLGRTMGEWSERYGSQASRIKQHIGKITNYFGNISVAEICMEESELAVGDEILIIGPTTGVYEDTAREIRLDLKPVEKVQKGVYCSIPLNGLVRRGDQVYKWITVVDEY